MAQHNSGQRPKVAVIGTGGTIASIGKGPLDLVHYVDNKQMLDAGALVARYRELAEVADVVPVPFRTVASYNIYFPEWRELVAICDRLVAEHKDLAGIVIAHGTASLEETAYALNLTLKVDVPVVIVGAQRPASALSSDAGINLVNAVRVAASPEACGLGVLVVLNDEIHAARDVRKSSTYRMQTFVAADFGALGHADGDRIAFYRKPVRHTYPRTQFDIRKLDALPRVDIAYAYSGGDGTAVRAFQAAGAKGIVFAGFPPGFPPPGDFEALKEAAAGGVVVVQSTRAMSGRTVLSTQAREAGFLAADNLTPQKARILLALALAQTSDRTALERMIGEY